MKYNSEQLFNYCRRSEELLQSILQNSECGEELAQVLRQVEKLNEKLEICAEAYQKCDESVAGLMGGTAFYE